MTVLIPNTKSAPSRSSYPYPGIDGPPSEVAKLECQIMLRSTMPKESRKQTTRSSDRSGSPKPVVRSEGGGKVAAGSGDKRSSSQLPKRYFAWFYYLKKRDRRTRVFESQVHRVRDGLPHLELCAKLNEWGIQYAGAVLNIPAGEIVGESRVRNVPELGDEDLVLLATRPPIEEAESNDDAIPEERGGRKRRSIECSRTEMESRVLNAMKLCFARCARNQIHINSTLSCDPQYEARFRRVDFEAHQGGPVRAVGPWRKCAKDGERVGMGYIAGVPASREDGRPFRVVAVFSSGGTETLFSVLLAVHVYPELLLSALGTSSPAVWQIPFKWHQRPVPEFLEPGAIRLSHPGFPAPIKWMES